MECREARSRIPLLDSGDLAREERGDLERHANACPDCAEELSLTREAVSLLREGAGDLLSEPPSAEELGRMLAGVAQTSVRRVPIFRMAAAAVVMLAATLAALHLLDGPPKPAPTPVEKKTAQAGDSPEILFGAAAYLKEMQRLVEAEAKFREVIEACETKADVLEYGIPARMQIAECLYRRKEYRKAHAEYDLAFTECRDMAPETAGNAAYWRYRSASVLSATSKDPKDEELKKEARKAFWRGFPDHPRAIDLPYYAGAELVSKAGYEVVTGQLEEAKKHYEAAIKDCFDRVKRVSVLYEKARALRVEALYKLERYDEAVAAYREVLAGKSWPRSTDSIRLANRRQAKAISAYFGALSLSKMKAWEEVIESLDWFDENREDRELENWQPHVHHQRVIAQVELGRLDEAEAGVYGMQAAFAKKEVTSEASLLLGKALLENGSHGYLVRAKRILVKAVEICADEARKKSLEETLAQVRELLAKE